MGSCVKQCLPESRTNINSVNAMDKDCNATIIYLSDATAYGGAEVYQKCLARTCASYEIAVHSWMPSDTRLDEWANEMRLIGAVVHRGLCLQLWKNELKSVAASGAIIVHANGSWRGNFLPYFRAAKAIGAAIVVTEHTVPVKAPDVKGLRKFAPWRIRKVRRTRRRQMEWSIVDQIICVGQLIMDKLSSERGLPHDKATIIENGVDCEKFSSDSDARRTIRQAAGLDKAVVIGSVGRLAPEKNYQALLKAVASLNDENISLLLVGDGPERHTIETLASELNLNGRVILTGQQKDVWRYLSAMDIFVLPSLFEALPFCILEAMSVMLPIIATNVGGITEAVQDGITGFVVPANNINILTDRLKTLVENAELRLEFGRAGQCWIEKKFSEEVMIRKTLNLYRKVSA